MTVIFTVLGLSLMVQVVNESNLSVHSEKEMQARNLAESGLIYFEKDILKHIKEESPSLEEINSFIEDYTKDVIGDDSTSEQAKITKVTKINEVENNIIEVHSLGKVDTVETILIGKYQLIDHVDIDDKTQELADFTKEGTVAIDFSKFSVLNIGLGGLLSLDLINVRGGDSRFYTVPDDDVVNVNVLGPILDISIGDGERFNTMEETPVIASRKGAITRLNILEGNNERAIVSVNLFNYGGENDTNVSINGYFESFVFLGLPVGAGYRDIDFQQFAVLGNANIQQDKKGIRKDNEDRRYFSFRDGLYVNRSLIIGDEQHARSNLGLAGEMVAMDDLGIINADIEVGAKDDGKYSIENPDGGSMDVYVHGDVHIRDSCIHLKEGYDFRIFTKGKIIFENKTDCSNYPGLYYAEGGVEFKTKGHNMTIDGTILADANKIKIDYEDKLTITGSQQNLIEENVSYDLIPRGREIQ